MNSMLLTHAPVFAMNKDKSVRIRHKHSFVFKSSSRLVLLFQCSGCGVHGEVGRLVWNTAVMDYHPGYMAYLDAFASLPKGVPHGKLL